MMSIRSLRPTLRVAVPLGVAAAVVALGATPALAATTISVTDGGSSVDGSQVTSYDTLAVSGHGDATDVTGLSGSRTATLTLQLPHPDGADAQTVTLATKAASSSSAIDLNASIDTSCPAWNGSSCVPAANGSYVFAFANKQNAAPTTAAVTLLIPPATVSGFRGTADGSVATFSWSANREPDLVDYDITDDTGRDVTPGGLAPSDACGSDGCGVSIDFGSGVLGTSRTFVIRAARRTAPGSSSTVTSSASAPEQLAFRAAPSPSPSPTGGSGSGNGSTPGTSPSGGGHTGTGTGNGGRHPGGTHRLTGKHPAAELHAYLPTTVAAAPPDLPGITTEVAPLPLGTYKPTLAYPDQVQRQAKRTLKTPAKTERIVSEIAHALDIPALWKSLAGAAILLLLAAHLRTWVEHADSATE